MIFKIGQRGLLNADPPGQRILGPVVLLAQQLQVIGQLHGTVYLRGIHRLVPHHHLSPCRDKLGFIPYRG